MKVFHCCAQDACASFAVRTANLKLLCWPHSCTGHRRQETEPGAACRCIPRLLHSACPALTFVCLPLQIGLLYLRYVGEPKSLWQDWLSHYMYDDQVRQSESLGGLPLAWVTLAGQPTVVTLPEVPELCFVLLSGAGGFRTALHRDWACACTMHMSERPPYLLSPCPSKQRPL